MPLILVGSSVFSINFLFLIEVIINGDVFLGT